MQGDEKEQGGAGYRVSAAHPLWPHTHPAIGRPMGLACTTLCCGHHSPGSDGLGPPALDGAGVGRQRAQHGAQHPCSIPPASPQLPWQLGEQTFRDTVCQRLWGHCLGSHRTPPLLSPCCSSPCPSPAALSSHPSL